MGNIFDGYLLVSDMDGTLLNSEKKISKRNLKAIEYFVNEGGKFTVATGRMVQSVEMFINQLKIELPTILHNGAKIYDYKNNNVISQYPIEEDRKEALRRIKKDKPNIGIEIFAEEIVYIYTSCQLTKRYEKHSFNVVYNMPEEIWEKEWLKVL
ncbi:MAG TPA: HAD-IIB family hydrolase, partial [Clostridium sp.]